MIKGVHTMFYTSQPEELRAFLRDKLGFSRYVDAGDGWLLFDLPEADMGCHPLDEKGEPPSGTTHVSFYCDDIRETMKELAANGVEFVDGVTDRGYALAAHFKMPGDIVAELYQPHYSKNRSAT